MRADPCAPHHPVRVKGLRRPRLPYHPVGDPAAHARPGDRPAVPRPPPSARPAPRAPGGPGQRADGHGPARLAPVRPARHRRAEPRPRAMARIARLPARLDGRAPVRRRGPCTRPTTRASRSCRPRRCRGTASRGTCREGDARDGHVRRARPARRGAARPDPARRPAVVRPTSSREPPSTGTGGRRTRSGRSSRRWPRPGSSACRGARAIVASTTSSERLFPAELLASDAAARRTAPPQAPVAVPGPRPARDGGQAEIFLGPGQAPERRRRARAELVEAGTLVPAEVEGVRGHAVRRRRGPRPARGGAPGARDRVAARAASAPGVAFLAPLDPLAWDRELLRACGTSTTSGRCTSPRRSAAGAITSCRSCSAIGSSDGSSRGSTARRGRSASSTSGGRTASTRWPRTVSSPPSARRSTALARFGGVTRVTLATGGPASSLRGAVRAWLDATGGASR